MTVQTVADVLAGACLISGALLSLAAGVGLLRFPDLLSRMHAATKPQVLGLFLLLAAGAFLAAEQRRWAVMAVLYGLASLTRLPGILLGIPLLILVVQASGGWAAGGWRTPRSQGSGGAWATTSRTSPVRPSRSSTRTATVSPPSTPTAVVSPRI